jgi:predicted HicB family RNase H-like nuclease
MIRGDGKVNLKQRLTIRMPSELNTKLSIRAQKIGISKNSLVLQILWEKVQKEDIKSV